MTRPGHVIKRTHAHPFRCRSLPADEDMAEADAGVPKADTEPIAASDEPMPAAEPSQDEADEEGDEDGEVSEGDAIHLPATKRMRAEPPPISEGATAASREAASWSIADATVDCCHN